jgi:acyl-CoA thioesterase-1
LRRVLTAAVLAAAVASSAGCASAPPPVSQKVQDYYEANSTPMPSPTQAKAVKVVVFGDSYAAGTGATPMEQGWVERLRLIQPWHITNLARGGTGYATAVDDPDTAQKACGAGYCPSYVEMIPQALKAAPDIVIVNGGRNDVTVDTEAEDAAVRGFYAKLRTALPKARIVAFNALWDNTAAPASLATVSAATKEYVQAVNGTYLDTGQPLAGKPNLIAGDGVHPDNEGHAAILKANFAALEKAGLTTK